MPKLIRVDAVVRGKVQRVGYRFIVQDVARRLGVKGYVQNVPDGTVKIIGEAPKSVIQKFIETLRVKELPVDVESIQVTYLEPTGEFEFFTIKYGDLTEEMAEGFGTGLKYVNLSRQETREGFQTSRSDMKEGFQALGSEVKAMREDMNRNFQEMSGKYDDISKDLGEAIRIIQDESIKTRNELVRAVDNLSRLVEEFVRERRRKS